MNKEITSSYHAFQMLQKNFNLYAEEVWVIALNSQLQVLGMEMTFRGTVDHCLIHPRDVFRYLVRVNASSYILAHNHPSLEVTPSDRDLRFTRKMKKISIMMQIPMKDHLVFSKDHYFSMADQGCL